MSDELTLTEEQVTRFEVDGFVAVRGFIPADMVADLREGYDAATRGEFDVDGSGELGIGNILANRHRVAVAAQAPIKRSGERAFVFQQQDMGSAHDTAFTVRLTHTRVPPPGAG